MAILDVTYHTPNRQFHELGNVWPEQEGSSEQLDFTSGTDEGAAQSQGRLARVLPDADCRVAVLSTGTATTATSRLLKANQEYCVYVPKDKFISVMAAA